MGGYEILEHTADIGIRATGANLEEVFAQMGQGLFSLLASPEQVKPTKTVALSVQAADLERLMVAWLRELLYRFDTEHFLGRRFEIRRISPNHLEAEVAGEKLDPSRHTLEREVKAVTYCDLAVKQQPDGSWAAQVILDI